MKRVEAVILSVVLLVAGGQVAHAQDRMALLNTALGDDVPTYGDSGRQVTRLQQFLNAQRRSHSLSPISVDGHFGPATLAALNRYRAGDAAPSTPAPAVTTHGAPDSGYAAKGTGYYPANNSMEGGTRDRVGNRLYTLQQYLAGKAPYVSVAMDSNAFPYGTHLRIPEIEAEYGRSIDFRVVDTGGRFRRKGTSRVDICTSGSSASHDPVINGSLHLIPRASESIGLVGAVGQTDR